MRTNIVIDDKLMADVMASGDFKTKRDAVEEGLRLLKRRQAIEARLGLEAIFYACPALIAYVARSRRAISAWPQFLGKHRRLVSHLVSTLT